MLADVFQLLYIWVELWFTFILWQLIAPPDTMNIVLRRENSRFVPVFFLLLLKVLYLKCVVSSTISHFWKKQKANTITYCLGSLLYSLTSIWKGGFNAWYWSFHSLIRSSWKKHYLCKCHSFISISLSIYVFMYVCMHLHINLHIYALTHIYALIHICVSACLNAHKHT